MVKMATKKLAVPRSAFKELSASFVNNVPGVWVADSGKSGPIVGITVSTHGNEPSGLFAYHYFRHDYNLQQQLLRGKVYFVLNNIKASARYFAAKNEDTRKRAREVDINMNRLPNSTFSLKDDSRYEIQRAQELKKIWDRFDYALDIHSMTQNAAPMIVSLTRSDIRMVARFPIDTIISNIDAVQKGKPTSYFYGKKKAMVYGIETGSHEFASSFDVSIACTMTFLALCGVISQKGLAKKRSHTKYRVFDSVWFQDKSYELTRVFKTFHSVKKGEIIARGNGTPIVARENCYSLFAPDGTKPKNITDEVLFLAHKV